MPRGMATNDELRWRPGRQPGAADRRSRSPSVPNGLHAPGSGSAPRPGGSWRRSNVAHSVKTVGPSQRARCCSSSSVASSQTRAEIRASTSALNGLGDVAAVEGEIDDAALSYDEESLAEGPRDRDHRWVIAACGDRATVDLHAEDLRAGLIRSLMEALHGIEVPRPSARRRAPARSPCRGARALSWTPRGRGCARSAPLRRSAQRIGRAEQARLKGRSSSVPGEVRAGLGDEADGRRMQRRTFSAVSISF